ncbi:MAG: VOC family protein [Polyangiaceae bacterium]|jgi:catechol 2,3-dioxygenase-like lactoylglutathione lyase family enzyme
MIAGGNATLVITDMDRALRFYVETLGFKLRARFGDDWAEVDAGDGLVLGLHRARSHGPKPGAHGSISVGFDVNQPIAEVVEVLANRGVQFHGPVKEEGAVKLAFFADPDGNALYLAEQKRLSS